MPSEQIKRNRRLAFTFQGGLCFWCDREMMDWEETLKSQSHPRLVTADHLMTRKQGGNDRLRNIVAACFECNNARKHNALEVWLSRIKFRLEKIGKPQHYEVILSRLELRGIALPSGHPSNGPRSSAERPPSKD